MDVLEKIREIVDSNRDPGRRIDEIKMLMGPAPAPAAKKPRRKAAAAKQEGEDAG